MSQNKTKIINMDCVEKIEVSAFVIRAWGRDGTGIGSYENKDRAKEVLQEILETHEFAIPTTIYKMPKS